MAKAKGKAAVEKLGRKLGQLDISYMSVDAIRPNPWNPNRQSEHEFKLLLKSMEEDGFTQPIVCVTLAEEHLAEDEALRSQGYRAGDVMVVDGEHRWRAGAQLGIGEVPVVLVPMTLAQARIATLRHNRARGSEDYELSAQVLRDLQELGAIDWAQDSLMLSDDELDRLLDDVPAPEALAGEEFGSAWDPTKQGEDADTELSDRRSSATPAAVEAQREMERRMQEAHSEEERQAVRRDAKHKRFALTFSGEEADIVQAIIGQAPAQTVLDLCRAELDRRGVTAAALLAEQEAEGVTV